MENYNNEEEIFKRGSFDELFESLSHVLCYFQKEGFFESVIEKVEIPQSISYPLILKGIKLITMGACTNYFRFILDFEFYKLINSNISNDELAEVILVKKSLIYLRELDVINFFELLNSVCSRTTGSNIFALFKDNFKDDFNF